MIYIISGTNRKGSRTLAISQHIAGLYKSQNVSTEVIDLGQLNFTFTADYDYASRSHPALLPWIEKINRADGLVIVCPEYNGSYPGILKYFIDHWTYPESFEFRPVCFVGLGGRFGGLRPVEHLQQVFGYRNAFVYPMRVFLTQVWDNFKDGNFKDPNLGELLKQQVSGFIAFLKALKDARLDANSKAKS